MACIQYGGPLAVPDGTIHDFLFAAMERGADDMCLINGLTGETRSFRDCLRSCRQVTRGLRSLGVRKDDVIMFYKHNSAGFVHMFLGALGAEAVVSTVNPASTVYELNHYFREVQPAFIFTEASLVKKVRATESALGASFQVITEDGHQDAVPMATLLQMDGNQNDSNMGLDRSQRPRPPEGTAVILFSSGTSGLPKAVCLSHRNLLAFVKSVQPLIDPAETVTVSPFPMYHTAGMTSIMMTRLSLGMAQVIFPSFRMDKFMHALEKYKVVSLHTPPTVLVQLAKSPLLERYDLSRLRYLTTGAGVMTAKVERVIRQKLNNPGFGQGYGLSESTSGVMRKHARDGHIKPGSSGKPLEGVEIKVVDAGCNMLGPDQRGELWVRGPTIMLGYLNRPEQTREMIDDQGWLHTGDLGYYDSEGYFYIVDRLKELIKYKGHQVAPAELEAVLLEHESIQDAAVVGVADQEAGELPCAFVVPKQGATLTQRDVIQYVAERVSHFKRLRGGVRFTAHIPKLPSGKILRRKLRDNLRDSKL